MKVHWWDDSRTRALRALRTMVLLAVTTGAIACGSDPASPGQDPDPDPDPGPGPVPTALDSVAGTFVLSAVNTSALPATILSEGGYMLQVTPSTATLAGNGDLLIAINTREVVAGYASNYADTLRGRWTQQGSVVRLTIAPESESAIVGWDGAKLTIGLIVATAEGNYVFTRGE